MWCRSPGGGMNGRKPVVWLHGEVKSPPFTATGRVEAGTLLRLVQEGESLVTNPRGKLSRAEWRRRLLEGSPSC